MMLKTHWLHWLHNWGICLYLLIFGKKLKRHLELSSNGLLPWCTTSTHTQSTEIVCSVFFHHHQMEYYVQKKTKIEFILCAKNPDYIHRKKNILTALESYTVVSIFLGKFCMRNLSLLTMGSLDSKPAWNLLMHHVFSGSTFVTSTLASSRKMVSAISKVSSSTPVSVVSTKDTQQI